MKKFAKMVLVAIPAFVFAAAVGMTTIGCGDDTTSVQTDQGVAQDMAPARDLETEKHD